MPAKVVSPFTLQRIYREARRAVLHGSRKNGYSSQPETEIGHAMKQAALRKIHVEFHKRLKLAGIKVES